MTPRDFAAYERRTWEALASKLDAIVQPLDTPGLSEGEFNQLLRGMIEEVEQLAQDCDRRAADAAMRESHARQVERMAELEGEQEAIREAARLDAIASGATATDKRAVRLAESLLHSPEMDRAIEAARAAGREAARIEGAAIGREAARTVRRALRGGGR